MLEIHVSYLSVDFEIIDALGLTVIQVFKIVCSNCWVVTAVTAELLVYSVCSGAVEDP